MSNGNLSCKRLYLTEKDDILVLENHGVDLSSPHWIPTWNFDLWLTLDIFKKPNFTFFLFSFFFLGLQ